MDVQEPSAPPRAGAPPGLSQREAEARRSRGEGNVSVSASSRSYARILRTDVFSFFNIILFVIGAALLALGRYNDAFTSVGLGLVNAAISAVQEIRAKRKLDRLQLLNRGRVTVVRDGRDVEVVPEEIVRGDVVHVGPGTRSWWTGRCSTAAGSTSTSRCSPMSPSHCSRNPATTCCRAASASAGRVTSSRGTSVRPATPAGSPPTPGGSAPTGRPCSGGSSSSSGW